MLMNNYYVIYESIQMRTMWRDIWFPGRTAGSQQYTTCRNSLKTWLWGESNFFYALRESIHKTTDERRSLHDWRGRDSGCPVAKTYCYIYLSKEGDMMGVNPNDLFFI